MISVEITAISEETLRHLETLKNEEVAIDMKKCVIMDDRIFEFLGNIRNITRLDLTDTALSVDQFGMLLKNCRRIENLILTNTVNLSTRYHDPDTMPLDHPEIKKANAKTAAEHKAISALGTLFSHGFRLLTGYRQPLQLEDKSDDAALPRTEINTAIKDRVDREKSLSTVFNHFDIDSIAWDDMQNVFAALSDWLADNTCITSLTFSHNLHATARGSLAACFMMKLVPALKTNRSLQYLDLSANHLELNGLKTFATLFETAEHAPISTLKWDRNIIGTNEMDAFKTLFSSPHCTIEHFSIDKSSDGPWDGSHPRLAVISIAAGMLKSSNQTLLTLSARGEGSIDPDHDLWMVRNLTKLLQDNRTLRSVAIDELPSEIEALLERNRSENVMRPRLM